MNRLLHTETERLVIRPYTENDLEESFLLMQEKALFTYLHFDVMTFDEYKGLFQWLIHSYKAGDQGNFKYSFAICMKESGQIIGWVGVGTLDIIKGEKEIYYLIGKDFWGNGYAFEAVQEIVKYSFETLGLQQVVAKVAPENKASKRIIEKAGFHFEQVLHDLPDEHADCNGELLYSLKREHDVG
jgi:ribosomal-protein-alanine N-acetyltransferase